MSGLPEIIEAAKVGCQLRFSIRHRMLEIFGGRSVFNVRPTAVMRPFVAVGRKFMQLDRRLDGDRIRAPSQRERVFTDNDPGSS